MIKNTSDWVGLFICVLISLILWFELKGNDFREFEIIGILQLDLPDSLKVGTAIPTYIKAQVEMIPSEYREFKKQHSSFIINISLSEIENDILKKTLIHQKFSSILESFHYRKLIVDFSEDLPLVFLQSQFKKIPVLFKGQLEYYPGYELADEVLITPDSITVYGPKEYLDSISHWETEYIQIKGLKGVLKKIIKLKTPSNNLISLSQQYVDVLFDVHPFTEKELDIEIFVVPTSDQKERKSYKLLPSFVRVFAKVSMDDYSRLKAEDFRFVVYEDSASTEKRLLPIHLEVKPDYVKSIKYYPKISELIVHQ